MPVSTRPKKKKPNSTRTLVRKYWLLAPVLAGLGLLAWLATGPRWWGPRVLSHSSAPIKGYIGTLQTVQQEYLRFHGKPLKNPAVERLFQLANQRIGLQDYESAALLLETVSQDAAVPVVFNDLGVLYAQLNDRSRAINAFREALARDIDYQPVRFNLDRLRNLTANAADPVSREIEPNNSPAYANVIMPGKPVEGEVAHGVNDLDYFRITTPPAPRDTLQVTIEPHSPELVLALRVFDSERRLTSMTAEVRESGKTLSYLFAPAPNTTFYLEVSGSGHSAGNYTLKVTPLRNFDNYEPNDDIFNARRIELGRAIQANIMDATDTDYYSFIAPRTGSISVTIHNRSTTLIPALTTFSTEMRNTGFGPDIRTPGAHLRHSFDVVENQMYYIQVWAENNTAGEYSVTIE
jgi:tetratricopeptide (TPR) repeat protein